MLTYASDFWPMFWTIIGSGAVLTVLLTLGVARLLPDRTGQQRQGDLALIPVRAHDSARHDTGRRAA